MEKDFIKLIYEKVDNIDTIVTDIQIKQATALVEITSLKACVEDHEDRILTFEKRSHFLEYAYKTILVVGGISGILYTLIQVKKALAGP